MRYHIISESNCSLLNISCFGYASDISVTHGGPGVRNLYIIHYVISGKGYFNGNSVTPGQGFLITPGMQEHYFPDESDPWEFLWIISDDWQIEKLFALFGADPQTNIFQYNYIPAVKQLSSFLIANNNTLYSGFEMLEIFLNIFKQHVKADALKQAKSNADVYIEAAQRYITLNIQNPIPISDLTAFLGVTQPYLFRIFKERFSKSPKQYVLDQKLARAQFLLTNTDLSVTHIANSVGFQDVLSFSRCFRSKLGISPQNYRKETAGNALAETDGKA